RFGRGRDGARQDRDPAGRHPEFGQAHPHHVVGRVRARIAARVTTQRRTGMPLLVIASIALQFFCIVHMIRSGRPYWWAFIIIIGSFLGSAVYIVTQVLPDLRYSYGAQRAVRRVKRAIDPQRERRRIEAELAVADTVTNRLRLAREIGRASCREAV